MTIDFWPNNDDVIIYVEKYIRQARYILVDFVDSNEFISFDAVVGFNYSWQTHPTMLEISNYGLRPLQEGTMYRISRERITALSPRIQIVENSLIIGFRIELNNDDGEVFGSPKSFDPFERMMRNIDETYDDQLPNLNLNIGKVSQVIIRNVGQGSWNEMKSEVGFELIFDIGTSYSTSKAEVLRMIGDRDQEYQKGSPLLIISHWDVDHYHFLLGLGDDTIKVFSYFIYRGIIPNLTARKALGRFRILNAKALIPIAPLSPFPKRSSSKLEKNYLTANGDYLLFNAAKSRWRNKSGLGLAIRKKNISIVLPGDYDYRQVSDFILCELGYSCNHYLIVPHHGGKAGKFIYNNSKFNSLKEAIISVGLNPYKPPHPSADNISALLRKGFKIVRTDQINGDHIIKI